MEKQLSNQESLTLITQMINQSKQNYKKSSFYFLLWGWVVVVADLGHYYLMEFTSYPHPYIVWLISIPAWIACAIYGSRQSNRANVKTHIDSIYQWVWIAFAFPVVVVIFAGGVIGPENITGMILLMAGYALFITGKLLKFQPIHYGALVLWISALSALYFNDSTQYLIGAVGTGIGYLVPGYMLKSKENNA
ncbi:MAG: hypothetical protein RIF33_02465 [Cyclobacteriaceae bacterium]